MRLHRLFPLLCLPITPTICGCSAPETISFIVIYQTDGHGTINGKDRNVQVVFRGCDATEVTAIPENGYRFIKWDDGIAEARRIDKEVFSSWTKTAYFAPIDNES